MRVHPRVVRDHEREQLREERPALGSFESGNPEGVATHEQVLLAGLGVHLDQRSEVRLAVVDGAKDALVIIFGEVTEVVGLGELR